MLAKGLNGVCDISQIYHGGRVFSRLGKGINGGGLGGGATLRSFDSCSSDRFPQSESRKMSNWCSWARFDAKDADKLVLAAVERALASIRLHPHGDVDGVSIDRLGGASLHWGGSQGRLPPASLPFPWPRRQVCWSLAIQSERNCLRPQDRRSRGVFLVQEIACSTRTK